MKTKKSNLAIHYLRRNKKFPTVWCPGCGNGIIFTSLIRAIDSLKMSRNKIVLVSGIGCSSRAPVYADFNTLHTTHGRAIPFATGVKMANPDLKVIVVTGDGDCLAIGGNHFIHACRRNLDVTILCMNNGLYGMTGGQVAPTTPIGRVTTTTPYGNIEEEFDLCRLAQTAGAAYVARWSTAHPHQAIRTIKKGIRKKGTAFVEILSPCPVHLKQPPSMMFRDLKKNTVPLKKADTPEAAGRIPIGEFCDIDKPDWITRYQGIIDGLRGDEGAHE